MSIALPTVRMTGICDAPELPPLLTCQFILGQFIAAEYSTEGPMPDLYAINLHLQERLERDWRDKACASEAAYWLDKAGLLRDYGNGLPLRRLLRAGRIAGQEQYPNHKYGSWLIRRLAKSRSPQAILKARDQMRRYLPIRRDYLPAGWPVNQGIPEFWQELGKTVAAFGYLEHVLTKTCYTLLATAGSAADLVDENGKVLYRWYQRADRAQTDSLYGLTRELERILGEDPKISCTLRENLVEQLDELRFWRNAICHGAWLQVDKDGSASLHHMYKHEGVPFAVRPSFSREDLSDIYSQTVDVTFRVIEAASIAGAGFALAVVLPREYEPRNATPVPQ